MTYFFDNNDGLLCDLDGVVYSGESAVPGAVSTLNELADRGVKIAYVTNNASRSPKQVSEHLQNLGVHSSPDQVFDSAAAGTDLLVKELIKRGIEIAGCPVMVVGSEYLRSLVRKFGMSVVSGSADEPKAVIQGFDPTIGWFDLAQASYSIQQGAIWVATNADLTIPRLEGVAPGNGALINTISTATVSQPVAVAGKPEPVLFEIAAEQLGMSSPLILGDRLDTDIEAGNRAGFDTALVLTGIHRESDIRVADRIQRPKWVISGARDLLSHRDELSKFDMDTY